MDLGNKETANKVTISMWRPSSHSARLRIRKNTKMTLQDTVPLTASKNKPKKWSWAEIKIQVFQEKQWQSFGYHQPCLAAYLQSQFISPICVSCAENEHNSIMNQDLLPDCTALHSEDSTNCRIILRLQKVNVNHLSAQVLKTTTTNKKLFCPQN